MAAIDTGRDARMNILRRDAEHKILHLLRTHGWIASIIQEGQADDHLIISAERGGHEHRIALLYSCATGNAVYRSLATQVEHIFYNGEPYMQESFAYGLNKPVGPVSGFFDLMSQWNGEATDGSFASGAGSDPFDEEAEADHRLLLSEAPIDAIWLRLRQFHSVTLAKRMIRERATRGGGPLPSDDVIHAKAEGVAFALRNATDYYDPDRARNVSQRVLNLYYGSMAFAFAEMLASPSGPSTLEEIEEGTKQGHGLYTVDGRTDGLQDLVVGVIASGFFPSWMRSLQVDTTTFPIRKPRKFSEVADLPAESWVTLESLFARIPEISDLFSDIFDSPAMWLHPAFEQGANPSGFLMGSVPRPRKAYAVMTDTSGRLGREDVARFPGPISEIQQIAPTGRGRRFRVAVDHAQHEVWWDALPLHNSPLGRTALIRPVFPGVGQYRAICMILLYALSIVVRYRPSVWRRVQEGDLDHMRVLIEAFLAVVERVLPEQFLGQISDQRVFAKQPGGFF